VGTFRDGFLWGAATSAYQIEGSTVVDGRGPSIWDVFSRVPGAIVGGETADVAADHYARVSDDLDLMASLGLTAYRFSVAWPRVQPSGRGRPNAAGLGFYDRLVDGLLARGIAPFATLYHWDLPQALQDAGGWPLRDTAERFGEYAEAVGDRLGDRVAGWLTLNEPSCSAWLGYATGEHAPGERDLDRAAAAAHHLLLGHARAVEALRTTGSRAIGIALNLYPVRPADDDDDLEAARRLDAVVNRCFLDPILRGSYPDDLDLPVLDAVVRDGDLTAIKAELDLLGVNYYFPRTATAHGGTPIGYPGLDGVGEREPTGPTTAMGWPVDPEGLTETLLRLTHEYDAPPLYVTENGVAFDDEAGEGGAVEDRDRIAFLEAHLHAAASAVEAGADLRGWFVWSLLDNFEWAFGSTKRFGIVRVDPETAARTPKASARWYCEVIARGGPA